MWRASHLQFLFGRAKSGGETGSPAGCAVGGVVVRSSAKCLVRTDNGAPYALVAMRSAHCTSGAHCNQCAWCAMRSAGPLKCAVINAQKLTITHYYALLRT